MSKVTITPWSDDLFDAREAEFASLVMAGVGNMTDTVLALLRKQEIVTAAAEPQEPAPPAQPPIPAGAQAAALASWNVWVETELFPAVTDVFNEGAELVVDALLDVYGQDARPLIPPVGNTYADEYLQHAYNRMVGVGENVWKGIKRELQAGLDAGEGIPQLADRLTAYAGLSEGRANTVARTEVISSANAGSYLQMVEAGLDGVDKEWLATDDHRTRISHVHADDQAVPLTAEFQVEVYAQGALQGTEPMEFPGDPIATPGNVINCRCSMSFSFDDDQDEGVLTAAAKFLESEHPRDSKGKFMNKLEIDLLNAKDKKAAYDKLTTAQKAKVGKATKDAAGVGGADVSNKVKNAADSGPPLGGLDKKTGKKAPAGKPVFLRVKTLFETDYEDGAIVAVRPNTNERVVWDAGTKRMQLQHLNKDGEWELVQAFTRGALMKEAKDEEGWFTPSPANTTPVETPGIGPLLPDLLPGQKPIKLRTQVVYSKKYADGELVAVHPEDNLTVVWDEQSKRMLVQRDGETQESLTRGALMAKYKDAEGWFSPGTPAEPDEDGPTSEITPAIDEPVPAPDITGVELSKTQYGTLEGFGKIKAAHSGTLAPVKGMYTSAYPTLEKLGLIETFKADAPHVPGQLEDWLRITPKGRAVLAAGPDGIVIAPKKSKKLYASWKGKVSEINSVKDYKYASVVRWANGGEDIWSWHSQAGHAGKGTLTPLQKKQGAKVVAVVEVSDKPITPGVVPTANVPETPQASAPKPADIPAVQTVDGIPAAGSLTSTGKVVGSHGATVYRDSSTGKEWLFKPSPPGMGTFMADADIATARLREVLGLPTPTFGKITIDGKSGSIQEMYAGSTEPFGYNFMPSDLSEADRLVIQKEHIFDWLVGNHDGHSRNYVRLPSGELVAVDKGQAFKFFGSDSLDPGFKPNNSMPAANLLMQAYANGEADIYGLDHPEIKKLLKKIDDLGFSEYEPILLPYATDAAKHGQLAKGGPAYLGLSAPAFPPNDVDAFMTHAWERKEKLKAAFKELYSGLAQKRKAKLAAAATIADADATPLEAFPAPPVQSSAADGVPVKLNAAKLQTAKYSHGEIVAVQNTFGERLIWDANIKKYRLQNSNPVNNTWADVQSFNKAAAVKYFANDFSGKGWTLPTGGTTHADLPAPLPKVSGNPVPTPAETVIKPFNKLDLLAQGDDFSDVPYFLRDSFYDAFRTGNAGMTLDVSTSSPKQIFEHLVYAQQRVFDELSKSVSLFGMARMMDRVAYQRAQKQDPYATNTRRVENAVIKLLETPEGASFAGRLVHGFEVTQTGVTRTHDEVKAIKVSKPAKAGLTSASFEGMTAAEGRAFYAEIAPTLSLKEVQTVTEYTLNDYTDINGNLRGVDRNGYPYPPSEAEYIRAGRIQRSMRPIPKNIRLYRGAGATALGFDNQSNRPSLEKLQKMVGKTFQDPGFTSTSVSKDSSFSYDVFSFVVEAPKGTPGIYVEPISKNDHELEMLLAAGTKFKIISVEQTGFTDFKRYNIVMRVVA